MGTSPYTSADSPLDDGKASMAKQYDSAPDFSIDSSKGYTATLDTNHGEIVIDLDAARSPLTVNNFVFLANEGFYDGVVFHRVIPNFMIQGGDPTGTGRGGPGYRFRDEIEGNGTYSRGTVAMANAGPNTNGSQFFIMHEDYGLPHNYTIFGQVRSGLEAVDSIASSDTDSSDRPRSDVVINKVTITEE
ncbi:MAG TPA: peptidylprolyl isomerase [Acidimicrobiia bacterium]|jgi:cyclophilin family peptidyl-prolyl cis-trans isomerase|nr:peptidylprolyl isomerase [Acidimicrobiia bacterium]